MAATHDDLKDFAHLLPPLVQDLIRALGWTAAMTLVKQYGGCVVHVPVNAQQPFANALHQLIGDAATALIAEFSGEDISIPRCYRSLQAARNARVKRDRRSGMSIRALAQHYQLTERWVYEILGAETNDAQRDLFGE